MKISDIEKVLLEQQDELEALEDEVLIHRPSGFINYPYSFINQKI